MAYRWHPKNAEVDPDSPQAWGSCDRCGMLTNLNKLQWQYGYQGSTMPQNLRILVCERHLDPLNPQDTPIILPPDPVPVFNARPEPYLLDEASWLLTQDGEIITTQDGEYFGTAIPNPSNTANTTRLASSIIASGESVATAYLDLFDGDPTAGGVSVLAAITGSATRTNIAASLTTVSGVAVNPDFIVVTSASASQTNISYVGIFNAASGGALLMSGTVSASPTIADGNPVQFDPLGLNINLN